MEPKDPADIVRVTFDWAAWLQDGDTIMSAEIAGKNSLVVNPEGDKPTEHTDTTVTGWIGGGAPNISYMISCTVHTQMGYTVQRSFPLFVREL